MELLLLCLCLVSLSGSTFAFGNVIIIVTEGNDVTLPCNINKNIESVRFEWKKDGEKHVYLYEGTAVTGVDPQFSGRVSHFKQELKNGTASITIRDTKMSDTGVYTCNFPKLDQTFTVLLLVGPNIPVIIVLVVVAVLAFVIVAVAIVGAVYICKLWKKSKQVPVAIVVTEGEDATLPCYIKNKNIVSERFEWIKDGMKKVYLYKGELLSDRDHRFRGRVSQPGDDKLKNGIATITIHDTKMSDSGVYTCNFPNLHQIFTVHLLVVKRT